MTRKNIIAALTAMCMVLCGIQINIFAADSYFSDEFDSLSGWKTNSSKVTCSGGQAVVNNEGNDIVYIQKRLDSFPADFMAEFSMSVESYGAVVGLNFWNGSHRIYMELTTGGIKYRDSSQNISSVSYTLGNISHKWNIVVRNNHAYVYIDEEAVLDYDMPTYSSDKIIQLWCKATPGQISRFRTDYFYFSPYSASKASQMENGIFAEDSGESMKEKLADVDGNVFMNEINTLYYLGVMEPYDSLNNFCPNEKMTRGDFAAVMADILPHGETDKAYFKDVYPGYKYYNQINKLAAQGIVGGISSDFFEPDKNIRFIDAMKIIMRELGYEKRISGAGGTDTEYYAEADRSGVLDGLSVKEQDFEIDRQTAAKLIYNALNTECLKEKEEYSSGKTFHREIKSEKFIEYALDIGIAEGVISENRFTKLTGKASLGRDAVAIGDKIYGGDEFSAAGMIGKYVVAFYRLDDDDNSLCYAFSKYKNSEITVSARDILETSTLYRLNYADDSKNRYCSIDAEADFLYNDVFSGDITASDMKPKKGYVTLIDNDNDGKYDVVKIYEYFNVAVKASEKNFFTVDDTDGKRYSFNAQDYDILSFVKNDMQSSFTSIKSGCTLSVFISKDKKTGRIIISENTVKGKAEQISEDTAVVGGKEYYLSDKLQTVLSLGKEYEFYADYFGELADIKTTKTQKEVYGYLLGALSDDDFASDDTVRLKILTEKEDIKELPAESRIKFYCCSDGTYERIPVLSLIDRLSDVSGTHKVAKRLIKYSLNSEGKVTEVYIPYDNTLNYEKDDNDKFRLDAQLKSVNYRSAPKLFNSQFGGDADTAVFVVPKNEETAAYDDYYVTDMSIFRNDCTYSVDMYDCDRANIAKIIVVASSETFSNKYGFIYETCGQQLNADDEVVTYIKGMYKGMEQTYIYSGEDGVSKLDYGDVLKLEFNKRGEVSSVHKIYSPSEEYDSGFIVSFSRTGIQGTARNAFIAASYGHIVKKTDKAFTHTEDGKISYAHNIGTALFYIVEPDKKEITVSSPGAMQESTDISAFDGSEAVIMSSFDELTDVIIYK